MIKLFQDFKLKEWMLDMLSTRCLTQSIEGQDLYEIEEIGPLNDPAEIRGTKKPVYNAAHREGLSKVMDKRVLAACRKDKGLITMGPMAYAQSGSSLESTWHKHPARSASERVGKPFSHLEI